MPRSAAVVGEGQRASAVRIDGIGSGESNTKSDGASGIFRKYALRSALTVGNDNSGGSIRSQSDDGFAFDKSVRTLGAFERTRNLRVCSPVSASRCANWNCSGGDENGD